MNEQSVRFCQAELSRSLKIVCAIVGFMGEIDFEQRIVGCSGEQDVQTVRIQYGTLVFVLI